MITTQFYLAWCPVCKSGLFIPWDRTHTQRNKWQEGKRLPLHFLPSSVWCNLTSFHLAVADTMKYAWAVFEMCQEPTPTLLRCKGRLIVAAACGVVDYKEVRCLDTATNAPSSSSLIYNQCDILNESESWSPFFSPLRPQNEIPESVSVETAAGPLSSERFRDVACVEQKLRGKNWSKKRRERETSGAETTVKSLFWGKGCSWEEGWSMKMITALHSFTLASQN